MIQQVSCKLVLLDFMSTSNSTVENHPQWEGNALMVAAAVDAYRPDEILQENKKHMNTWKFEMRSNQFFCGQIWKSLNHRITFFWRNFRRNGSFKCWIHKEEMGHFPQCNHPTTMTWTGSGQKATQCAGFGSALRERASSTSLEDPCQAARRNLHFHARRNRKIQKKSLKKDVVSQLDKLCHVTPKIDYQPLHYQPPHWTWPKPNKKLASSMDYGKKRTALHLAAQWNHAEVLEVGKL